MLGDIERLLFIVNSIIWLLYLLGLYLALHVIKNWSYRVSLAIWLLSDLIKLSLTPFMQVLSDFSHVFARMVWYPTLMLLGVMSLYLMLYFHQKYKTKPEKESELIFTFIVVLVLFNAVRFFDRVIFGDELLEDVYKYGILLIKIFAALAILYQVWAIRLREQGVAENWKF